MNIRLHCNLQLIVGRNTAPNSPVVQLWVLYKSLCEVELQICLSVARWPECLCGVFLLLLLLSIISFGNVRVVILSLFVRKLKFHLLLTEGS